MRKLVFFVGGAGAGKTTLAKSLARKRGAAVFDMDTLLRPAAVQIMTIAGLDPYDRDSEEYKLLCRDLGYRMTMDAALENIDVGTDAFVIGPFTKETSDPAWIVQELASIGATLHDVDVKAIIVYLQDDSLHYSRIEQRGLATDQYKLGHWDSFSRSLGRRALAWELPESSVLYYDNSRAFDEAALERLERFVYGDVI
ncbi:AAA domain-containing protein [Paenibacillus catalpae]|uniref:AAA domain-containing protein n=1 Tax=Paenibacillus catalpae TaxID=1045775 RepID=A0A1I1X143_9BACL|nr:AAA family ATPase [Paenibacillus catalpae]SFD99413.1 AAA domain-containing protein [Paenibacillus catalpae]